MSNAGLFSFLHFFVRFQLFSEDCRCVFKKQKNENVDLEGVQNEKTWKNLSLWGISTVWVKFVGGISSLNKKWKKFDYFFPTFLKIGIFGWQAVEGRKLQLWTQIVRTWLTKTTWNSKDFNEIEQLFARILLFWHKNDCFSFDFQGITRAE